MTELMLSTGFQSSRRMLRQMLPSRSMFGWYTYKYAGGGHAPLVNCSRCRCYLRLTHNQRFRHET